VEAWKDELFFHTPASLTGTLGGIAATGSLVLWPSPQEPRLMSLVPPLHIALLNASEVRDNLFELMHAQRWTDGLPTNALLVSGPSKTADIQQTLAYGAHGPKELLVLSPSSASSAATWSAAGLFRPFIVAVLAVLETSLSFDNAVVNATVLRHMDEKWRQRFLLWGILIAVFGMRIVFPLAIVGVVANMGPMEVIDLALFKPTTTPASSPRRTTRSRPSAAPS
jgi:hypothetical protein